MRNILDIQKAFFRNHGKDIGEEYNFDIQVWEKSYDKIYEMKPNMNNVPLTFEILSSGNIFWKCTSSSVAKTIEYSKNNEAWTSITSTTSGISISVNNGDIIYFRGNNDTYASYHNTYNYFSTTCNFNLKGNIMSLISNNFNTLKTLTGNYAFVNLFYNCSNLINADELILAADTLSYWCYFSMFKNCSGMINPPKVPAMNLSEKCYGYMFQNCTSMVNPPQLPATNLISMCYNGMFCGCNITKAPDLLAPTLVNACYQNMFEGCRNINYIKCLAINNISSGVSYWLYNAASSNGIFIKASDASWPSGSNGIPSGWTVQNI